MHYVLITLWSCPEFLYAAVTANKTPGLGLFPPILCCRERERGAGFKGKQVFSLFCVFTFIPIVSEILITPYIETMIV